MVNQKPLKNTGPPGTSFLLRKKFWVCKNRTTELRERSSQTLSVICRGGPEFPKFPLEIQTQLRLAAQVYFKNLKIFCPEVYIWNQKSVDPIRSTFDPRSIHVRSNSIQFDPLAPFDPPSIHEILESIRSTEKLENQLPDLRIRSTEVSKNQLPDFRIRSTENLQKLPPDFRIRSSLRNAFDVIFRNPAAVHGGFPAFCISLAHIFKGISLGR